MQIGAQLCGARQQIDVIVAMLRSSCGLSPPQEEQQDKLGERVLLPPPFAADFSCGCAIEQGQCKASEGVDKEPMPPILSVNSAAAKFTTPWTDTAVICGQRRQLTVLPTRKLRTSMRTNRSLVPPPSSPSSTDVALLNTTIVGMKAGSGTQADEDPNRQANLHHDRGSPSTLASSIRRTPGNDHVVDASRTEKNATAAMDSESCQSLVGLSEAWPSSTAGKILHCRNLPANSAGLIPRQPLLLRLPPRKPRALKDALGRRPTKNGRLSSEGEDPPCGQEVLPRAKARDDSLGAHVVATAVGV